MPPWMRTSVVIAFSGHFTSKHRMEDSDLDDVVELGRDAEEQLRYCEQ